jgi:energy-coupling factor transport system substrate-specific component
MKTSNENYSKFTLKFLIGIVLCLFARLIPFRVPNVEPILATTMPFSRAYGALTGFSFAVLSILLYDVVTHTLGVQTIFTAGAYGILGLWSAIYFKKNKGNTMDYVRFAIFGTLVYDALTGLTIGPIFFHQSFMASLLGQIPFTAFHLVGNIAFAIILSPAIYSLLIKKKKKEKILSTTILNPKLI